MRAPSLSSAFRPRKPGCGVWSWSVLTADGPAGLEAPRWDRVAWGNVYQPARGPTFVAMAPVGLRLEAGVTYAAKLSKAEAELDFRPPAAELAARVRAFAEVPESGEAREQLERLAAETGARSVADHRDLGAEARARIGAGDRVDRDIGGR